MSENEIVKLLQSFEININNSTSKNATLTLWGSGSPYRESLHIDDLVGGPCISNEYSMNKNPTIVTKVGDKDSYLKDNRDSFITQASNAESIYNRIKKNNNVWNIQQYEKFTSVNLYLLKFWKNDC